MAETEFLQIDEVASRIGLNEQATPRQLPAAEAHP